MNVELRADGLHISGYVNAVMRESRPVITSRGKVVEIIEERAFQRALERADNVPMTLDHDTNRVLAQTNDNTLTLYEDSIGLRAEAVITDDEVIKNAKKLLGWSFGMKEIKDEIEERADKLPLRRVKDFVLDHITLVLRKRPVYSATSVELRAGEEEATEIEMRASDSEVEVKEVVETPSKEAKETVNISQYKHRINKLRVGK